jgi:lipid-binding SYLF domain-containing protein
MTPRTSWSASLVGGLFLAVSLPTVSVAASKADEARADIREATSETLDLLYEKQPSAQEFIAKSAGYAVFSNFGMKLFVAGGGTGKGMAVNNETKAETFMKMVEIQAGLGFGVKKFRLVWVLVNKTDFDEFVNAGWELGAQATAAAQVSDTGGGFAGALSIKPGVYLYQLTDDGLAVELTAKGTRYYKDDDLN